MVAALMPAAASTAVAAGGTAAAQAATIEAAKIAAAKAAAAKAAAAASASPMGAGAQAGSRGLGQGIAQSGQMAQAGQTGLGSMMSQYQIPQAAAAAGAPMGPAGSYGSQANVARQAGQAAGQAGGLQTPGFWDQFGQTMGGGSDRREQAGEFAKFGNAQAHQGLAAFGNKTRDVMFPNRSGGPFGPNVNPGISGMMRQLDWTNRGGFGRGVGQGR